MTLESPLQLAQRWLKETIGSDETVVAIGVDDHQLVLLASLVGPGGKVLAVAPPQPKAASQQALMLTGFFNRVTFLNDVSDLPLSSSNNQQFAGALIAQTDDLAPKTTLVLTQKLRRGGIALLLTTADYDLGWLTKIKLANFQVVCYSEISHSPKRSQLLAIKRR